jgi:hypothetical protein
MKKRVCATGIPVAEYKKRGLLRETLSKASALWGSGTADVTE